MAVEVYQGILIDEPILSLDCDKKADSKGYSKKGEKTFAYSIPTSMLRLDLSSEMALKQPGIERAPCPTSRSTNKGFLSRRTAYAARICDIVDFP